MFVEYSGKGNVINPHIEKQIIDNEIATFSRLHRGLYAIDVKILTSLLKINTSLKKLEFVSCKIYDDRNNQDVNLCDDTIKSLHYNTGVTTLNLCNYHFSPKTIDHLIQLFSLNSTLRELVLDSCKIGPDIVRIADALTQNKTITYLNLDHNGISKVGVLAIGNMLTNNNTLRKLNLSSNSLGELEPDIVANCLFTDSSIQELILQRNRIGSHTVTKIAEMLAINHSLLTLDLSVNYINCDGAISLSQALAVNKILQCLNLRINYIESSGMISIAEMLESNETLQKLYLYDNTVDDDAVVALAQSFKYNIGLTEIELSECSISSYGISEIFKSLKSNETLHTLKLLDNKFCLTNDNPPSNDLCELLTFNFHLRELYLDCKIDTDVIINLTRCLASNSVIDTFIFDTSFMNSKILNELAQILEPNFTIINFGQIRKWSDPIDKILNRNKKNLIDIRFKKTCVCLSE